MKADHGEAQASVRTAPAPASPVAQLRREKSERCEIESAEIGRHGDGKDCDAGNPDAGQAHCDADQAPGRGAPALPGHLHQPGAVHAPDRDDPADEPLGASRLVVVVVAQ